MPSKMTRFLIHSAVAAVLFATAMSTPAMAQNDSKPKATSKSAAASPQQLQAEARKIGMQLNDIEKAVLKGDADLMAKSKHLSKHVMQVMKSKGFFPEADRQELIRLKKSIQSGKLSKDDRKAKINEFRGVQARMIKGRQAAMQDKDVQKESREFGKATMLAMQKHDPNTSKLIRRLGEIKQQLMAIYKQRQAQAKAQH